MLIQTELEHIQSLKLYHVVDFAILDKAFLQITYFMYFPLVTNSYFDIVIVHVVHLLLFLSL